MMPILGAPEWLAALAAVAVLAGVLWWTGRRRVALTRSMVGGLLVLALTNPTLVGPPQPDRVVYVTDRSASVPEATQQARWSAISAAVTHPASNTRAAVVQVDGEARIVRPPSPAGPSDLSPLPVSRTTGTALAEGLALAGRLVPPHEPATLFVDTDGHTHPSALQPVLDQLASRGITVAHVPVEPPVVPAAVTRLELPHRADVGATISGTLSVWGGPGGLDTEATVALVPEQGDPVPLDPLPLRVPPGKRVEHTLTMALPADLTAGLYTARVALADRPDDPVVRGLHVDEPPRVLVVQGNPRDGAVLAGVLEAEGFQVTRVAGRAAPVLDDQTDLVVLAGTPTTGSGALSPTWVGALGAFVEAGGGLLTLAGPGGYAAGGWQDSALAPLLPVRIDPDGAEKDDTASLLVILDKSGSMARPATDATDAQGLLSGVTDMMVGGRATGSKIRVAAEAAAATMTRLRDHDRVGVLAVDTLPYWSVKMTPASERAKAMQQTRRISAGGGGMYVLTALEAAAPVMLAEDAPLRHILMLVDASDAGEQTRDVFGNIRGALQLATELRQDGVTLSIVGIGNTESRDSPYLRKLTRAGGGRMELTPDIRRVSALFAQEVERLVGSAEHEQAPVRVGVEGWHPALKGVDMARAPRIYGWADVLERPRARTILATPAGTPVFAVWNRGQGQVASWTSDDGARWARGWPAWSESALLWTQLARDLSRPLASASEAVSIDTTTDTTRVRVAHTTEAGLPAPVEGLVLTATVDGSEVPLPTPRLVQPGVVEVELVAQPGARVTVSAAASQPDGPEKHLGRAEAIVPSPEERDHIGVNAPVVAMLDQPADGAGPRERRRIPLWPWLLGLAAALLPLDAWARRHRTPSALP